LNGAKLNDLQKHELRDWSNEIEEILDNIGVEGEKRFSDFG
jgi:hypothetical protein